MRLYNSLTRKIEEFKPLNPPKVGIYGCGPTVYDFPHIGNLRSFILYDILRRVLELNHFQVTFIENITDIEDKIIKKAREKNITISELTSEYTKYFFDDLKKLNIKSAEVYPKATEHIGEMVKYIEELIKKGLAYIEKDGSVYFDISEFKNYGKLSGLEKQQLKTGTRILSDEYSKDDIVDFALWKAVDPDEAGYDSPWGRGRPGWHIECSVMSQKYLGDTFDMHLGGIDLLFPHHENEIAQSEGKTGKKFANFFLHGEHLLVEGQKMSKSLNNFFTLKDLADRGLPAGRQGFEPLAYRYLMLTGHYRDKLNFTWESLKASQNALNNLRETVRQWEIDVIASEAKQSNDKKYYQKFLDVLNNNLNTPQALAIMWNLVHSNLPTNIKAQSLLKMDQVLGLKLEQYLGKKLDVPENVQNLVQKREQARKSGDFEKADDLRKEIKKLGFEIEDTPSGPKVK